MTGIEIVVYVGYAIMAAGFIYGMYMMNKAGGDMESLDPSTLDDFNITKADEGSVVPLVYGRRKVTGNIIWYGNLTTEPIYEKVDTGKDDEWVVTGYNYFLDIWQTLGHGDMTIIETYMNADLKDVEYTSVVFNGGSDGVYSTIPGEYATQLAGICHVFYEKMLLGENVQSVPTIHFVVERLMGSDNPINNKNMSNGINPAAIVYDLLRRGGAGAGDFNLTSFNNAADYWYSKGLGLNVVFTNKPKTRDAIKQVLQYVGAAFGQDDEGLFYLNALDEDDSSVATLSYDDGDFNSFSFERQTWDKLHTDFIATYIDEDKEYTERTVKAYNPAIARILGRRIENSIKLQGFRDLNTASKRVWEIMKEGTYPFANVQTTVPMRFYFLKLGDVITLNNSKYGISNADFRVMRKTVKGADENSLALTLRQKTESLYDSNWTTVGGSEWTSPNYTASVAYATKVWQLPFNHITGDTTSYLSLAARTNTFETGYAFYKSYDDSEFTPSALKTKFAQYGTLDVEYPLTYEIDEIIGLTYTPYQEDPRFDTISLEAAMQMPRLALIEDELIGFATVTLNGDGSITLTDCIRGMLGTTMVAHSASTAIWLFYVDSGILYRIEDSSFYYKMVPYSLSGSVDVSSVSSTLVTKSSTQSLPKAPKLYIEDNVTDLKVTLFGHFFDTSGAGMSGENTDSTEAIPGGRIGWRVGTGTPTYETTNPFYVTRTTSNIYFWYEKDGVFTPERQVAVVYGDLPKYYGFTIPDTDSGLIKLSYGQQAFMNIADYDFDIIRDLIYLNNLLDTDMTGIVDEDYIVFDSTEQKFIPVGYSSFIVYGGGLDALPIFEGEHGPYDDGSMTASSYLSDYPPQHSWDGGDGSLYPQWIITDPGSEVFPDVTESHWIQWDWTDHGGSHDLRGIRLYTRYNASTDRWPSAVKVYGSNTGSFSGEESLLFDGELLNATSIYPNNWTGWTEFTETENFDFYVHHRIVITDVYTYDSGSYWFAVDQWQFKEALPYDAPTSFEVVYGYTYGVLSDLYYHDFTEITLIGLERTVPLEVNFNFERVAESSVYFNVIGRYEGVESHNVKYYVYNYDTSSWDEITSNVTDMEYSTEEDLYYYEVPDTLDYISTEDKMSFKIRVVSSGDENDKLILDKVALSSPYPHVWYDDQAWTYELGYTGYWVISDYNKTAGGTYNSYYWRGGWAVPVITTGDKVYFEFKIKVQSTRNVIVGVAPLSHRMNQYIGYDAGGVGYLNTGDIYWNRAANASFDSYTQDDIIGIAVDFSGNKIWFSKNGVWYNSGDPASGTNPTSTDVGLNGDIQPAIATKYNQCRVTTQFRVSEMSYSVPSGFTALVEESGSSSTSTTT